MFRIKNQLKKKIILHHRMYESSRKSYKILLSRKLSIFETWQWRQELFRIENQLKKKISFITGCMSQPDQATSSCYLENYWMLGLDHTDQNCLKSIIHLQKFLIIIIGCLSHPENYWILRLDYEDIFCLKSKQKATTKIVHHDRM